MTAGLPDSSLKAVEIYCDRRVPSELRDEIEVVCRRRGRSITIVERRAPWDPERLGPEWTEQAVAQLRHDPKSKRWSLHWRDSSDRWHGYEQLPPSPRIDTLLAEIDSDPTGIFWG